MAIFHRGRGLAAGARLPLVLLIAATLAPAPANATARALLVAVSGYPDAKMRLEGPANDARLLYEVLIQRGFDRADIRVLADGIGSGDPDGIEVAGQPTRQAIVDAFGLLAAASGPGDEVFIAMSGHGTQQPARDRRSEPDGLDELFLPIDVGRWDASVDFDRQRHHRRRDRPVPGSDPAHRRLGLAGAGQLPLGHRYPRRRGPGRAPPRRQPREPGRADRPLAGRPRGRGAGPSRRPRHRHRPGRVLRRPVRRIGARAGAAGESAGRPEARTAELLHRPGARPRPAGQLSRSGAERTCRLRRGGWRSPRLPHSFVRGRSGGTDPGRRRCRAGALAGAPARRWARAHRCGSGARARRRGRGAAARRRRRTDRARHRRHAGPRPERRDPELDQRPHAAGGTGSRGGDAAGPRHPMSSMSRRTHRPPCRQP